MIASFDGKGNPRPVRFRIEDREESITLNIKNVISKKTFRTGDSLAISFFCQSEIGGLLMQYELVFFIKDHRWVLYKM